MLWYLIFIYEESLSICVDAPFEFISTTNMTLNPFTEWGSKKSKGSDEAEPKILLAWTVWQMQVTEWRKGLLTLSKLFLTLQHGKSFITHNAQKEMPANFAYTQQHLTTQYLIMLSSSTMMQLNNLCAWGAYLPTLHTSPFHYIVRRSRYFFFIWK